MKSSSLLKIILPILIIFLAILVAVAMISMRKPPEKEEVVERALLVEAKDVVRENVEFVIRSQGEVRAKNYTRISAQVSGKVVEITALFQPGRFFTKGDVLLRLERDDFETDLKLASAELARAKASLDEEVARGKVAEEEWRSVNNQAPALGLRKPQLAREQANVKAAEANYERALRNLARTEIRAPYNGLVISRDVDVGQFMPVSGVVGQVSSTDVAEVRLPLTNTDLAFIDFSTSVSPNNPVTLNANVAGEERFWQGRLVRSEGVMDSASRVIHAVVEVNDPYGLNVTDNNSVVPLRFGQFVKAEVAGTRSEDVVVLSRNLLRLDGSVLTVSDNLEIKIVPVQVVRSDARQVYIGSGLEAGDKVIVSAVPNPYNGMKVRLPDSNAEAN